ncbi:hypothetical protein JCM3775_001611 [Rhodotorula graminis]
MVLLQLTSALHTRLEALASRLPLELRARVASHLDLVDDRPGAQAADGTGSLDGSPLSSADAPFRTIPHDLLVAVSTWAKDANLDDRNDYRLASLLRLTDVHAPPPAPRVKSSELLAILSSIQLSQDRLAYASLTSLLPAPHPSLVPLHAAAGAHDGRLKSPAEEWTEIRRELGAVVNVAASMAAVASAVWWVSFGFSYLERIALSFLGALAIAAVEAFLYYRFFTRASRAEPAPSPRPGARAPSARAGGAGRGAGEARRVGAAGSKGAKQQ